MLIPIELAIPSFILGIGICIIGLMSGIISLFLMSQYAKHIRPSKLKLVLKIVYSSILLFLIGVLLSIISFILNILAGGESIFYIQSSALVSLCIGLLGWYLLSLGVTGLYREWTEKSVELELKLRNIETEIETKAGTGLGIPKPEEIPPFVIDELRKDIKAINQRLESLGIPAGAIKEVEMGEAIPKALKQEIELIRAKIEVTGEFYGLEKPIWYFMKSGNFYLKSKEYGKAIEQYEEVLKRDSKNANALFNRGLAYFEKGDFEEAREDYELYLEKINPLDAAAYNNRGLVYDKLKQHERAIDDYNKAIELDPNDRSAYNNRGVAYRELKQYEKAIENHNKAIELNPEYAGAYGNRGNVYSDKGNYERAIEDYNKVLEIDSGDVKAYLNRGTAYRKLKQYEKEQEDYKKALELDPNHISAMLNFSESYIVTKNYVGAHEMAERALNIAEESEDIIMSHFLMICSSLFQNKKEDARSQLNRLIDYLETIKDWTLEWDFSDIKQAIESSDIDENVKSLILSLIELLENKITVDKFKSSIFTT